MSEFYVAPIVEGYGEVDAVPILLRRLLLELRQEASIRVNPPLRVKAGSFVNDYDYFARYFELAARKAKPHPRGSVLILLDCEDDCPGTLGPALTAKAAKVRGDVPIVVALAHPEYETWFLAAARSLRGEGGLRSDLDPPSNPESLRDAKGWLGERMLHGYNAPNDQPRFTSTFSFQEAAVIPSFTRLRRKLNEHFSA